MGTRRHAPRAGSAGGGSLHARRDEDRRGHRLDAGGRHGRGTPHADVVHIFVEVSAQLLPATPTAHLLEHLDVAGPLLAEPLQVKNGCALVPERPGIGLAWDEAALARHAVEL